MVFLPGDHVLDMNIKVANVTRLTMRGESSSGTVATIVCSGSVGLSFKNMAEFKIDSLVFTSFSGDSARRSASKYALLLESIARAELVTCSFHNNNGNRSLGGAIYVSRITVLNFSGTDNFINNSAAGDGGAIYVHNTQVSFSGSSNFINNSAARNGGAIYTSHNTRVSFSGTSNLINNVAAGDGGAIYTSHNTRVSFSGTSNLTNNVATGDGGAIYTSHSTQVSFSGTSNLTNNVATGDGGAIYTSHNTQVSFSGTSNLINNSATRNGGAIYTSHNTRVSFSGTSNLIDNSATRNGGAIYTSHNTRVSFSGTSNFISNVASFGGKIYTSGGAIYTSGFTYGYTSGTVLDFNETNNIIENSAFYGRDIHADFNSALRFNETNEFTNNLDRLNRDPYGGGGVYIGLKCSFSILPNTTVYWENNHAGLGGAIYVADASPLSYCTPLAKCVPQEECFFQLPGQNLSNGIDVQLIFKNNSATIAGSVLYGGAIDNCKLTPGLDSYSSGEMFDMIVNISDDNTDSKISSLPFRVCQCENNYPDCTKSSNIHLAYAGETKTISVVGVGQRNGIVPGAVQVNNVHGVTFQYHLKTKPNHICTIINYTVFSRSHFTRLEVYANGPCSTFSDTLNLDLHMYQYCPPGFSLESVNYCICEPRLAKYISPNQCHITNGLVTITRFSNQHLWVGYDNQSHGLILHSHCPIDYCVNDEVVFPLDNTDVQCAYNRSGLLCGACKEGYSLILGTSHCKQCTNSHLFLLIPFAVMGVALVLLLLVCKLTVATGTLSGLMFYANIVGVNRTIFLPVESTDALSIFIAWLNLDFGIETCFYDGLDAYSKTWLQFVFPVYIWMLVGLIILVSHFSRRFAKLLGKNPVSVLATLILLSYTKILRSLIAALYITYLEYPTYNRSVWLYNANIDYLSGKHIPLFIVAVLVFLFLFLPYTLLLLFGQWLQAISYLRLFSWINRLKPFMDSYHAPYKANHRYWAGLLLVLRFVLLLVFAFGFDLQQDTSITLLAVPVGTGILVVWAWINGGVYRNWCLDALEASFTLNLTILSAFTMYIYHVGGSEGAQFAVGYSSVSIALATFIGILVFQLAKVTGVAQYLKTKCTWGLNTHIIPTRNGETESDTDSLPDRLINPGEYEPVPQTAQEHTAAELTGSNDEEPRRQIFAYTHSSLN